MLSFCSLPGRQFDRIVFLALKKMQWLGSTPHFQTHPNYCGWILCVYIYIIMISLKNKTPNPWCWLIPANGFQKLPLKCAHLDLLGCWMHRWGARPADGLQRRFTTEGVTVHWFVVSWHQSQLPTPQHCTLPSGYLTQLWYRWPIEINDFPSQKPPFSSGIFRGSVKQPEGNV